MWTLIDYGVQVESLPPTRTFDEKSGLRILCRRVGLAAFTSGAGLYIDLPFHLRGGTPLHLRALDICHHNGKHDIENMQWLEIFHPFTSVKNLYLNKELRTTYRPRPARARQGKSDRCVTCPGESLFGRAPAIGTCPGSHWAVRCCTTTLRSPCSHFSLETPHTQYLMLRH